jgi:N-acetylglutamate synthase-like GNAT family acetyltransferase
VAPELRRQGVGTAVVGAVEDKARELGFEEIYLFTLDREEWYASLGWSPLESVHWRGHPGVIMRKSLRSRHAAIG